MATRLTKYGRREWTLGTVILAAGVAASIYFAMPHWHWSLISVVPLTAIWLWILWFFRDPQRSCSAPSNVFVSPADGKVTDITPVGPSSPLGQDGLKVGIFMSVFSVHVNRSPAGARVRLVEHLHGVFLDARDPLSGERNESATLYLTYTINGNEYPVVIRQIAGLIARRIVTDLREGQELARGERIGMIKFGSRMEVLVPRELAPKVLVSIGQKVRAGETPILAVQAKEGRP